MKRRFGLPMQTALVFLGILLLVFVLDSLNIRAIVSLQRSLESEYRKRIQVEATHFVGLIPDLERYLRGQASYPDVELLLLDTGIQDVTLFRWVEVTQGEARSLLKEEMRDQLLLGEQIVQEAAPSSRTSLYFVMTPIFSSEAQILGLMRSAHRMEAGYWNAQSTRSLFLYQMIAFLALVGVVVFFARWMIWPYRRLLKMTREASVPSSPHPGDDDRVFLVESFQAVIRELKDRGKELEALHAKEHERAEEMTTVSETITRNIPSGVLLIDRQGTVVDINEAAADILMKPAMELKTRNIDQLFEEKSQLPLMIWQTLRGREVHEREEVFYIAADGTKRIFGISTAPLLSGERKLLGALCLMRDITEIEELRATMRTKENLAHLGELSAGLAHELRNSLGTILGFAKLVLKEDLSETTRENLQMILTEGEELRKVVNDFLRFARPQELSMERLDLECLITSAIEELGFAAKGIQVEKSGSWLPIEGDPRLLSKAFLNLLRNSMEAIEASGVKPAWVKITSEVKDEKVRLLLADNGGGISPEIEDRLFVPFFTTKDEGVGMGLALAHKVIVSHGGDLSIVRRSDGIAQFRIELPIDCAGMGVMPKESAVG